MLVSSSWPTGLNAGSREQGVLAQKRGVPQNAESRESRIPHPCVDQQPAVFRSSPSPPMSKPEVRDTSSTIINKQRSGHSSDSAQVNQTGSEAKSESTAGLQATGWPEQQDLMASYRDLGCFK